LVSLAALATRGVEPSSPTLLESRKANGQNYNRICDRRSAFHDVTTYVAALGVQAYRRLGFYPEGSTCTRVLAVPGSGARRAQCEAKLKAGGKVADIACGHGSSTILLAQAFPNTRIFCFDFHEPSIQIARRKAAAEAGLSNVEFHVAEAKTIPGSEYDLACIFDALHDMGDPVGAARHIRETLKPDRTFMLVEPLAGDHMREICIRSARNSTASRQSSARRRRLRKKSVAVSARKRGRSS
jgi:SAM-dependent methyltransferase